MTRRLSFVLALLSTGLLTSGYFLSSQFWKGGIILAIGIVWMVGLAFRWIWVSRLCLFLYFGVAAYGLLIALPAPLMIPGAIFTLLTWDLAEFQNRMDIVPTEGDYFALEKSHLVRLFSVALVGGGLSFFALEIHLIPSFGVLVILILFIVWGIVRMVNWLIKNRS